MCADSLIKINVSSLLNTKSKEKTRIFSVSKYAASTLSRFSEFYDEAKFADFVLTASDHRKFYVHSIVLAAASDYFNSLLSNHQKDYSFDSLDFASLERIIRFCYTGEIELSSENIEKMANASHELRIPHLKAVCSQFIEKTADATNCLQYALIADRCGLRLSKELAEQFLAVNCANISKDMSPRNAVHVNDVATNLSNNESKIFENVMKSVESISGADSTLLLNAYQAIYRSFFIAGYMQSFISTAEKSPVYSRQDTFNVSKTPMLLDSMNSESSNDEGLFIIAKSKCEGMEIYAISDFNRSLRIMPKYHIDTDKINIELVRVFPVRDRIFFSYIKDQKLLIKSWTFKRQTMVDVTLPPTVQYLKPRLTNAVGGSFYVSEEKYVAWPYEGYKTIVCKFGLDSECYKCIEVNCGGMKEIIGSGDEIFVINQKSEVSSFNLIGGKRIARGTLTYNGIIKAVIYHGNIYVGNYIRSKCTLFVEQFKKKSNQWITIASFCTYSDASNYHIGATENYLYIFHSKGKVQRYNDVSGQWTAVDLPDNFNQTVLCVSTSPFTCFPNHKF
ncbi:uncharacterized protein LOC129565946 [Sitodiplosis mosellana]|uniref:uncharacterized protein LOC129565946 n=1 Tax=Sitodiplosis mosellana TaxID=263140 RepID=UPI0024438A0A|nr:uncharacterized protein LOC129565946 [Sitodiplosis mosellana]